jgi:hypothetical protein
MIPTHCRQMLAREQLIEVSKGYKGNVGFDRQILCEAGKRSKRSD